MHLWLFNLVFIYINPFEPPFPSVQSEIEMCHTGNKGDTAGPGAYDPTDAVFTHRGYSHFHKNRGRGELFDITPTPGPDAYQANQSCKEDDKGRADLPIIQR